MTDTVTLSPQAFGMFHDLLSQKLDGMFEDGYCDDFMSRTYQPFVDALRELNPEAAATYQKQFDDVRAEYAGDGE